MLIHLGLRLLLPNVQSREKEKEKEKEKEEMGWLCPKRPVVTITPQPVLWSRQSAGLQLWRRCGLCVYSIDAWCLLTVKVDGRCFPDVELLM